MKVLIAAGGTGGHIYPALAIAESIKKINPTTVVEFVQVNTAGRISTSYSFSG